MTFLNSPIKSFLTLILLSNFLFTNAQQPAFPTAYGAGAYTAGGRGGEVVHVTNLDDDGAGSLRWALTDPSNKGVSRTIVFDVSGLITLNSDIYMSNLPGDTGGFANGVTIAGQSSPRGGITITGGKIRMKGIQHVIWRYVKFRETTSVDGCLSVGDADNIILDHLSGSHTQDIVFSVTANGAGNQADKHTVQNCLMANSKNGLIIGNSNFTTDEASLPYGAVSILRNAYYSVSWRVPGKFGGAGKFDVINNVAHNWSSRLMRTDPYPLEMNHIGNHYQSGGQSRTRSYPNLHKTWTGFNYGDPEIYQEDNYYSDDVKNNGINKPNQWSVFQGEDTENVPASYFPNTQFPIQGRALPIINSMDIKDDVLQFVGASKYIKNDGTVGFYRDQYDTFQVNGIATQDLQYSSNRDIELPVQSISNTREEDFYVSNPHIPEVWFTANVPDGADHNTISPSGYTYLEDYLNQVDFTGETLNVESIEVTPNSAELQIPETLQLTVTFTPQNATNQNGTWTSSNEAVATVDANGLVTSISEGEVTITFTSADGGFTGTSEITVFPEALQASAGIDQQICEGGSATLTATGGSTYLWSNGATTASITVSPNSTTTYTVTAYDATAINSSTDSVTVTVNPLPTANAGQDLTICKGTSVTLTASGGGSYLWSNGATSASITVNPNSTTTYTVEVAQNGCTATDDVRVTVNQLPSVNAGEDVTINPGESVTLNATGASTYSWDTGASGASISVSPTVTTTYTVTGTNANGCSKPDSVTVFVQTGGSVAANAGEDVSICTGSSTTLTASGGSTYLWSNGATTASITVSPNSTTTYTVTAYDATAINSSTDSVTVTVNPLPTANAGQDLTTCKGTSVTLTASGGGSYLWSNGATSASITVNPNSTTTYTVEVAQNGCTASDDVRVTVNQLPSVNAGEDVTINPGESVTLNATGASTYSWNTGASGASISVSPTVTTTYTVTGTNANGCSRPDSVTVFVQTGGSVAANAGEDVSICTGSSTTLTASGGSTYLWSNGATTASITVSPNSTTTYTVTAYDATAINSSTDSVTVTVNPLPTANAGQDLTTCMGTSVTLTASGGGSYLWSNGATSASITVNPNSTTTYTVEVAQNGCTATDDVRVTVNQLPSVNAGEDVTINPGESVTLNATGASTYSWDTGASGASISVSPTVTTTYTVTGTNANGCSKPDSVTVFVQTGGNVAANAGEDVSICTGSSTTLTASGGSTYLWSNGATTASITVSPNSTTTYTVTAYDATAINSSTDSVTVTVNPLPTANAGQDLTTCMGTSVTLTASGGGSYLWSNGATSASITVNPNSTTTYTVEVTQNGCTATDDVSVTVNQLPSVNAGEDVTINPGQSVTLNATGASTYSWNTGASGASISVSPTVTTTYTVTGNTNGCQGNDIIIVNVVENTNDVNAYAGEDQRICRGYSVTLTASGGDTYVWSTGETTQSIHVSPENTTHYTVTAYVGDNYDEDEVSVFVSNNPNVNITNGSDVTILQGEYVTLSATGANRYEWNNGATQANIAVNPNGTTVYKVTGFNLNNCYDSKEVRVNVVPVVIAFAGNDQTICRSEEATLTATGGDEYLWSTGETTASILVSPEDDTEYSVTVYNDLDYDTADVMVYVNDCNAIESPENPEYFDFLVYPNPTAGELNVKISGMLKVSNIALYDLSGKLIYQESISNNTEQNFVKKLDLSPYSDGLYLLKLVDDQHSVTKKIVIHR